MRKWPGPRSCPSSPLAIERVAEGRDGRFLPGLALAFAALAPTHLPTCVLMAHLAPLYAWAYAGPRAALLVLGGGLAGAGLSACFTLPAMGLLKQANFEGLEDAAGGEPSPVRPAAGRFRLAAIPRHHLGARRWLALGRWPSAILAARRRAVGWARRRLR